MKPTKGLKVKSLFLLSTRLSIEYLIINIKMPIDVVIFISGINFMLSSGEKEKVDFCHNFSPRFHI